MGQALRQMNPIKDKADLRDLRKGIPHAILLVVSVIVFIDMEKRLSGLREKVQSSMSEREYDNQKNYNQIIEQLKEFDGEAQPLQSPDDLEQNAPTYKYQFVDDDD
jgi:hypothetical protein